MRECRVNDSGPRGGWALPKIPGSTPARLLSAVGTWFESSSIHFNSIGGEPLIRICYGDSTIPSCGDY